MAIKAFDFTWLYTCVKNHSESDDKTEKKSVKHKHSAFSDEILQDIEPIHNNALKFINQLHALFNASLDTDLTLVNTRVVAAKHYFIPLLKTFSKKLLTQIDLLKNEKQVKTYLNELLELEGLVYKHIHQIEKTVLVIDGIIQNKLFNKQEVKQLTNQAERLDVISQHKQLLKQADDTGDLKGSSKKVKPTEVKIPKPNSKLITFELYKSGKKMDDIVIERSMAHSTIEGHLAHYVELGLIPVSDFVTTAKREAIIAMVKERNETLYAPLKAALGDAYSYSDIRFALAYYKNSHKKS